MPNNVLIGQKKPRLMGRVIKIGGDILSHPPGRTVLRLADADGLIRLGGSEWEEDLIMDGLSFQEKSPIRY
jgi:hypothetical protein